MLAQAIRLGQYVTKGRRPAVGRVQDDREESRTRSARSASGAAEVLSLQQSAGNQAVARLLAGRGAPGRDPASSADLSHGAGQVLHRSPVGLGVEDLFELSLEDVREAAELPGGPLWAADKMGLYEREHPFSKHRRPASSEARVTPLAPGVQRYAHGGFMGAAAELMKDSKWRDIYRTLMPAHYEEARLIADAVVEGFTLPGIVRSPGELMLHLENNPVLAAYGSMKHQREVGGQPHPLEAPDEQHKALTLEWDVWLPPDPTPAMDILSEAKIAHGGPTTTVLEKYAPGVNRLGVLPIPNPLGGGPISVGEDVFGPDVPTGSEWMTIFGRAIAMARAPFEAAAGGSAQPKIFSEEHLQMARRYYERTASARTLNAKAASELALEFLGPNGGLHVEIKSWDSEPEHVALFVEQLRAKGITVRTVSSWKYSQLGKVENASRTKWVHGLRDLREFVFNGRLSPGDGARGGERDDVIEEGDEVGFNAGALLREDPDRPRQFVVDEQALQEVVAVQRERKLKLQLYVQENEASPQAVDLITQLANSRRDVFELGFSWGNISGRAEAGTSGGSGFGKQAIPGEHDPSRISLRVWENT
jgi:hypothetical protein